MYAAAVLAFLAATVQAKAADLDRYLTLTQMTVKELVSGTLADPRATQDRLKKIMEIGIEACRDRIKANPGEAKLLELVIAEAPKMVTMKPEALEDAWGDEGTAGEAVGVPLSSLDQFSEVRNFLDIVVHPARAHDFIESYVQTKDRQALVQAKGELIEVIEHVKLMRNQ